MPYRLLIVSSLLLCACGQKGPLYTPEGKTATEVPATSPVPAPASAPSATEPADPSEKEFAPPSSATPE